jgi:hypothetical protein
MLRSEIDLLGDAERVVNLNSKRQSRAADTGEGVLQDTKQR